MIEIIIFIFIIYCIARKSSTSTSFALEDILRQRNFIDIEYISGQHKTHLTAKKGTMKYLFVKYNQVFSNTPSLVSQEMQSIKVLGERIRCDRVIIYYNAISVPLELTKVAATYNIEIWNKVGTSNFNSFRTVKPNSNNSRLAGALVKESEPLEYRKNGVIAQDTCHITPTTSPIKENPKSFFKKKGPQRL